MRLNIIFMGTPIFGKIVLERLSKEHNIVAVVCPLDKPNKRGNKIEFCEVKKFALGNGIKVLQFEKVNRAVEELKTLNADMIVTASFGQIISKELLNLCPLGTLNVHGSILPLLRGASPVPEAIRRGFKETGVTIIRMNEKMDEGDMLEKRTCLIGESETASELMIKVAKIGGEALMQAIDHIISGDVECVKQDNSKATYCGKIKKEEAKIDFSLDSEKVKCHINAFSKEPGAYFEYEGAVYKVLRAESVKGHSGIASEVLEASPKGGFIVACGSGAVRFLELQASGGKVLNAKDFLNGKKFAKGSYLNG